MLLDLHTSFPCSALCPSQPHSSAPQCFPTQGSVRLCPEHLAALPNPCLVRLQY